MPPLLESISSQQRTAEHPLPNPVTPETNNNPPRPLSPNLSIAPITASTLPAYRRLITLLLPIRYTDKFYKDSVADPSPFSLALCALWHETPRPGKRKLASLNDELPPSTPAISESKAKVIGGIQCRLEPLPFPPPTNPRTTSTAPPPPHQQPHNLYIQTLAILSPYRNLGIATALLDAIISTALTHYPRLNINVKEIYAHVWEANEDALEWYGKRGFDIGGELVEGYYRKLKPSGARIVKRKVGVGDWVGVAEGWKTGAEDKIEGAKSEGEGGVMGREGDRDGDG